MATKIEWTRGDDGTPGKTWNPLRGCTMVSDGCTNCYAMKMAHRFSGPGAPYEGLTRMTSSGPKWNGSVRLVPEVLDQPLRWRKPRRIFVNSMSDLFHEDVPDEYIDRVFAVMACSSRHTYQVLTKRPERMQHYVSELGRSSKRIESAALEIGYTLKWEGVSLCPWPLHNVWLGVSVEHQKAADERIPLLLETPATVRFLSVEPLIGDVDLFDFLYDENGRELTNPEPKLHWIIVGGESGPGARPCDVRWIRSIVEQCSEGSVPCFVKQLGARAEDRRWLNYSSNPPGQPMRARFKNRKGADPSEWPEDLRVQEWPTP